MNKITIVNGERYRDDILQVLFVIPKDKTTLAALNITLRLMSESSAKYKTKRETMIKVGLLYGASLGFHVVQVNDNYLVVGYIKTLSNRYRKFGSDLQKKGQKFLSEILLGDWSHDLNALARLKKEASIRTKEVLLDPGYKSLYMLSKTFCEGSPLTELPFGTLEEIESVDESKITETKRLISSSPRFVLGVSTAPEKANKYAMSLFNPVECDAKIKNVNLKYDHQVEDLTEETTFTQSAVTYAYKRPLSDDIHHYVLSRLAEHVLGSPMTSILFTKVREENSLCYDISVSLASPCDHLIIRTGIDGKNYKRTISLIDAIMNEASKYLTTEMFESSKSYLREAFDCVDSTPSKKLTFLQNTLLRGYSDDPQDYIAELDKVTIEEVKEYLDSLTKIGSYGVLSTKKGQ